MGIVYTHHNDPTDPLYGQTTSVSVPDPPKVPVLLTKTAFQDYAVSQLGAGTTGMARFQAIMDAAQGNTGAVKFCYSRYEAADVFNKSVAAGFISVMVGASIMTSAEQTAVLNNWPTG